MCGTVTWSTQNICYSSLCCCVGDCVLRHCHLYPLYSWQDILLTLAEMELASTTMFTPRTNVMFIRYAGALVLVQVVGYSEHGDAYCHISCECAASVFFRFAVQFLCLKMCVHGGSIVPRRGDGVEDPHVATVLHRVAGDRLPWVGQDRGGGLSFCLRVLSIQSLGVPSARAVQLFGRLAVVETHTLWYFGHHCCLVVGFDALGFWHSWMFTLFHPFLLFCTHFSPDSTTSTVFLG